MSSFFQPMRHALREAERGFLQAEVPVGAVLVKDHHIIAGSHNLNRTHCDPTAHAEIIVIRRACQILKTLRLNTCQLFVTLEPCAMCAQAIANAHIAQLIFGAYDPKSGGVDHGARVFDHPTCHHQPKVIGGVMEQECAYPLKLFFEMRRS